MEILDSTVDKQILEEMNSYDPSIYTDEDVINALKSENCSVEDYKALLSPAAANHLEEMARRAMKERIRYFGKNVYMFTPLYISNYCENQCVYCGFNCKNNIRRAKLNFDEIEREMEAIAKTGLEEILILTGESPTYSDPEYIGKACEISSKYFKNTGLEIYPVNSDTYTYLHSMGADFVTVFEETYNPSRYEKLHLGGNKRCYPYRTNTQERAIIGGMRGVGFGALLGLSEFRHDAFATGFHAYLINRKYPHAEIALSCPRLRPTVASAKLTSGNVHEKELLQIICAYRIFLPFASITISTRESALFRDNIIKIAATKISAGVNVGIGGHTDNEKGDEQFEISDPRTVDEIFESIQESGYTPVLNDYIYV